MPRDIKPRGRISAYGYFTQACREDHRKENSGEAVVFAEFSKKCRDRWKVMSDMEKKRFADMADRDSDRFAREMQVYTENKRHKRKKGTDAPNRSLSAFFWFCNDERARVKASNPEYGIGEVARALGRGWAQASPEARRKYQEMAERDKARYEREMAAYKSRGGGHSAENNF